MLSSFEIQWLQSHATSVERLTEKADNFLNLNINSEIVDILFGAWDRLLQAGASALCVVHQNHTQPMTPISELSNPSYKYVAIGEYHKYESESGSSGAMHLPIWPYE
jgi:hypothetical protein